MTEPRGLVGVGPPDPESADTRPALLLAEDDASVARALVRLLQEYFHVIDVLTDGETLITRVEQIRPDVVVTDVWLDGLDGFSATRALRRRHLSMPIVLISGRDEPGYPAAATASGASAFVHKRDIQTLVSVLQAVLAGHRPVSRGAAFTTPIDGPVPRRHEMVFCSNDAAVIDDLARFIAVALNAGDAAFVLVTESHWTGLLQWFRAHDVDIDGAFGRGTCISFDADIAPDPVRFREAVDGIREAAVNAGKVHPRVAFAGERAGRLWAEGRTAEAIQLERLCDELADDVDILCLYPEPYEKDDQALTLICARHTAVSFGAPRDGRS